MNNQIIILYTLLCVICVLFCKIIIDQNDDVNKHFDEQQRTNMVFSKRLNKIPNTKLSKTEVESIDMRIYE